MSRLGLYISSMYIENLQREREWTLLKDGNGTDLKKREIK